RRHPGVPLHRDARHRPLPDDRELPAVPHLPDAGAGGDGGRLSAARRPDQCECDEARRKAARQKENAMAERIGFVGVGKMGLPISHRLLDAGYGLVIYDIDEAPLAELAARGAERAGSAAEVGDKAEIVLVSLPTPDIVETVILGEGGIAA